LFLFSFLHLSNSGSVTSLHLIVSIASPTALMSFELHDCAVIKINVISVFFMIFIY